MAKIILYIVLSTALIFMACADKDSEKIILSDISTLAYTGQTIPSLSLMDQALRKANINLEDILRTPGVHTLLIPSDKAFKEFFDELGDDYASFDDFDQQGEIDVLKEIIRYHIVKDTLNHGVLEFQANTFQGEEMTCLPGEILRVTNGRGQYAQVLKDKEKIGNASIRVIDKVLMPPSY